MVYKNPLLIEKHLYKMITRAATDSKPPVSQYEVTHSLIYQNLPIITVRVIQFQQQFCEIEVICYTSPSVLLTYKLTRS